MTYIIAEIGQNHDGDLETARELIHQCAEPIYDEWPERHEVGGVDAVKMCKRDLACELTVEAAARPYDSPHSFGATYGEHRAALELSYDDHCRCYTLAKALNLDFIETVCAPSCVDGILELFTPDMFKVASRDLTNGPLLERLAATGVPTILSTGMATKTDLDAALGIMQYGNIAGLLHCLSVYPAPYDRLNMRTIQYLQEHYPQYPVGFSDHSIGIALAPVGVALGAQIIEKHITFDRAAKGSDHAGSLEPDGLKRIVRDIRNVESAMGGYAMFRDMATAATKLRLERSICSGPDGIKRGERVGRENIAMLSPGIGISWQLRDMLFGKKAKADIPPHTTILEDMLR